VEFRKHIPQVAAAAAPLTAELRTFLGKFQAPLLFDETSEEQCCAEIIQELAAADQPAHELVHHVIRMGSLGTQLQVDTAQGAFTVTVAACLAPEPPRTKPQTMVGIFWVVAGTVVVGAAVPPEQADYSEEMYRHGDHHEYWHRLQSQNAAERDLKARPYDFWPRGRLVFLPFLATVRIYVDPCLWAISGYQDEVLAFFAHHSYRAEFVQSVHYCCAGCDCHALE
jgi:hypothetical protein